MHIYYIYVSCSAARTPPPNFLRMVAFDAAVQDGNPQPARRVASLKLKGYYPSCVYKWKHARKRDSWSVICAASPKLAKRFRELPDSIRQFLGKPQKFSSRAAANSESSGATSILPEPFRNMIAEIIVPRQHPFGP